MEHLPLAARKVDRYSLGVQREVLEVAKWEMWERGRLRYLCLPNAQTMMYDRFHEQTRRFPGIAEPLVLLCHRQLGKSHLAILLQVEECLQHPGSISNFGLDTMDHAQEIFDEKIGNVIADMPPWISMWRRKNIVYFRNSHWPRRVTSQIILRGLDYQRGDRMRGGNTGFMAMDEVRNIQHLEYVIRHVVTPMFIGQKEPRLLLLTTPPDNPQEHDFYRYYMRAMKSDSLVVVPASKNPDWTADDDRLMLAEYGSRQDVAYQRELECKMIADRTRIVVPEWSDSDGKYYVEVVERTPGEEPPPGAFVRPEHYRGYVTIDAGWKDYTAAVLSLYDFERKRIVALAEIFVNYTPTVAFAELLVETIEATFPEEFRRELLIRADANALVLADLNVHLREHEYFVAEVDKYDRDAAINNLRSGVQLGRVYVALECVHLNQQLSSAMLNKKRTDFERTKSMGHCDLLVALNYQYRHIIWDENPLPPVEAARPRARTMVNPYAREEVKDDTLEVMTAIFNPLGTKRP